MATTELTERYLRLAETIASRFGSRLTRVTDSPGELSYEVPPASLLECCRELRDTEALGFEMLMDLCGVDYSEYGRDEWRTDGATATGFSRGVFASSDDVEEPVDIANAQYEPPARFAVVYHLLSLTHNHRVRLKIFCEDDEQPMLDSVTGIWASADWYEREAFDLFGILFRGHPDLRRILTDYGFIGHPFRKDFSAHRQRGDALRPREGQGDLRAGQHRTANARPEGHPRRRALRKRAQGRRRCLRFRISR